MSPAAVGDLFKSYLAWLTRAPACPADAPWLILPRSGRVILLDLSECDYVTSPDAQFDPHAAAKYVSQYLIEYESRHTTTTGVKLSTTPSTGAVVGDDMDREVPWEPWMGIGRPDMQHHTDPADTLWRAPSRQVVPHRTPDERTWDQGRLCHPALDQVVIHLCYLAGGLSWNSHQAWLGQHPDQPRLTVTWPTSGPGADEVVPTSAECWTHAQALHAELASRSPQEIAEIHIRWTGEHPDIHLEYRE